jgi:hypothetical protein
VLQILALAARWNFKQNCFSLPSLQVGVVSMPLCLEQTSMLQTTLKQNACGSDGNKTNHTGHS